ncbi:MAG: hypothetical protein LBT14_13540 [Treponema sp.]|jgi:hypothetical protein|nr:hypothetical protein [Treponema sp.]
MTKQVADESLGHTLIKVLANRGLRNAGIGCVKSIFYNFFFLQYKAAFLPGRIPVSAVDHPLDTKIPFIPQWVAVYLDFVAFWVRMIGFLLETYRRRGMSGAMDFIDSMGKLYTFAAEVYAKNLSTTDRPHYLARPRFAFIHATDPHLMCIPSLHVMVVIRTYTKFRDLIRSIGDEQGLAPQIEEIRQGALVITEAVLYVKQHSINCIAAALYAMTRFDESLFPPEEAEDFVSHLFSRATIPAPEDRRLIRNYILELYRRFLQEGSAAQFWAEPLLAFLSSRRIN